MVKPIILPISYKSDPKGLRKAEQDLKSFASGIGKVIAGAVTAVAGIGIASVKAFADFDAAMNQSLAIMGDVSDALRKDMSDAAREVAKATTFSAKEAAESYFFLASAGLDAEQSIAALPKVAAFAQAGMFDMARATDLLTDAQSALGLSSDDVTENLANMSQLGDVLVKANTLANASVEQFASALTNKAAASMRTLNMEMEEGVSVLAVFADQGLKGEAAGTAFNATMLGLTKNARTNAGAFKALGVEVFDSTGELNSMADIVAQLEAGLDGMSTEQVEATLSGLGLTRQALDGTKALLGNSEALREYEGELRNAGGTVDEIAEKQLQTFSAQLQLLGSRITDVGIEIGSKLTPILMDLVDDLEPVIDQVGDVLVEAFTLLAPVIADVAKELPTLLSALVPVLPLMVDIARTVLELAVQLLPIFLGVIQALLPFIQRFAGFLADNADKVAGVTIALAALVLGIQAFNTILGISKLLKLGWAAAMGVATVAQKALNVAMKANPIGIVITLIGLLVGALIWFFTQTETGRQLFETFVNFLSNAMQTAVRFFTNAWNTIVNLFANSIIGIINFFRALPGRILAVLSGAVGWLRSVGENIIQGLRNGIDTIWRNVTSFFSGIPQAIRNLLSGAINWLSGIGRSVIDGFLNGLKGAWTAVTDWIGGAAERVSGAFKNILGIKSPSKVFMEHGLDIGRGLAIGLSKIQPEVMQRVTSLADVRGVTSDSLGMGASIAPSVGPVGGGVTVVVNAGMGTDGAEVGRKVVDAIRQYERRSGKVFAAA